MIVDALNKMEAGALQALPQPDEGVTYAAKIGKEEAKLDWSLPAIELARKVRAFNPFPGAHGQAGASTVKIWHARAVEGRGQPGQLLAADAQRGIVVACGEGALLLTELQKPGGKKLAAAEFLKGFSFEGLAFE
jgi:methionyl-tRNA formyltransferase